MLVSKVTKIIEFFEYCNLTDLISALRYSKHVKSHFLEFHHKIVDREIQTYFRYCYIVRLRDYTPMNFREVPTFGSDTNCKQNHQEEAEIRFFCRTSTIRIYSQKSLNAKNSPRTMYIVQCTRSILTSTRQE